MKTLHDLGKAIRQHYVDPYSGPLLDVSAKARDRINKSVYKDTPAHLRHMATVVDAASPDQVPVSVLTEDFPARLEAALLASGKGTALARNCKSTATLFRAIAVELGHVAATRVVPQMPKRQRLTGRDESGRRVELRGRLREHREPYAADPEKLPPHLQAELAALKRFYTAPVVFGRRRKALRGSTWDLNEERMMRFYGALVLLGHPLEQARLADLVKPACLEAYGNWQVEMQGDATYTLKDVWVWAANVARNYLKDKDASDAIWSMINQTEFVRVNDNDRKIQTISADDLCHIGDCLHQHAHAYAALHFDRKPGKAIRWPKAMTGFHVGRALMVELALLTWLRRENLVGIVHGQHLVRRDGRLWFTFTAEEMKTREPHSGEVRDLWRGAAGLERVEELLAWYLELRPYLVERFLAANPGAEEPKELFLGKYGAPYGNGGAWHLFSGTSRQYLGPEKEISPHNVRHIMASRVLLKYRYPIFSHVQALLGHKSSLTTEMYYARVKNLLSAEMGQAVIDEQREQAGMAERIRRVEAKLDAALQGDTADALLEMRALVAELRGLLPAV